MDLNQNLNFELIEFAFKGLKWWFLYGG